MTDTHTIVQTHTTESGESYGMVITDADLLPEYEMGNGQVVKVDKVKMIRIFRNFTGGDLRTSKFLIEALLSDGAVNFTAYLSWERYMQGVRAFKDIGVALSILQEEVDEYDWEGQTLRRRVELLGKIPQLPDRQDAACEQLGDLLLVAKKLGMHDAAEVLGLLKQTTDKAKEPPHYYAPMA